MKLIKLAIPGGTIYGKAWGHPESPPVLALHGWLDNANSFDLIAPYLQSDCYFIAIDLPGHGHSFHLPPACNYHFIDGIFIVIQVLEALKYSMFHLIGHSMGASLASLIAGIIPQRVLSLGLIEAIGPLVAPQNTASEQLTTYAINLQKLTTKVRSFESIEHAALIRSSKNYISYEQSKLICSRALKKINQSYYWRHDKRLYLSSPLKMTEEQVLSCLTKISCNTQLILASHGYKFKPDLLKRRIESVQHLTFNTLEGRHHIHMEQPEAVAQLLAKSFNEI